MRTSFFTGLVVAALTGAGCGSSIQVRVARYDVERSPEAETAYRKAHPGRSDFTPKDALDVLARLQTAVGRYESHLVEFNRLVQMLMNPDALTEDAVRMQKDDRVREMFRPLAQLVSDDLGRAQNAQAASKGKFEIDPRVELAWEDLQRRLAKREDNVESDPAIGARVAAQLKLFGNDDLDAHVALYEAAVSKLDANGPLAELVKVVHSMKTRNVTKSEFKERVDATLAKLRDEDEGAIEGLTLELASGDLVPRLHEVFQDMSDPYLMYIAAHGDNWQDLPNAASASGDGDGEYILVFEKHLDARWKHVSMDPTKVVQARLRIGRKVASAAVAAAGIATGTFAVPLAKGSAIDGNDSPDFSRVTGEASRLRRVNDSSRKKIGRVANFARNAVDDVKEPSADQICQRLISILQTATQGGN